MRHYSTGNLRKGKKRILIFTKYDRKAASTRYRFLQYLPFLQNESIGCEISHLLDNGYLKIRFATGRRSVYHMLKGYLKRLKMIFKVKRSDLVIIYCELFPYMPAFFEKYLTLRNIPYIVDLDDAIFHSYEMHPNKIIRFLFKNKIGSILAGAKSVITGNEYLAEYALKFNGKVVLLPTVVDVNKYQVARKENLNGKVFRIGWIGSPSTALYLKIVESAIKQFCSQHNAVLVLVGSGKIEMNDIPVEIREWDEKTEIEEIKQFDVGIMPLPDSPWARGKCGFKLIQYMACGLPVIASPVGANKKIVEHGINGFFAATTDEWVKALSALYEDFNMRIKMGKMGRQKIEKEYSLQVMASRLLSIIKKS